MSELKAAVGKWPALSAATAVVSADVAEIRAAEAVVAGNNLDWYAKRHKVSPEERQMLRDMLFGEMR